MSPQAQRIAIAEACGWRYSATASPEMKVHAIFRWIKPGNEDWHEQKLPDFLVDLNAMHAAEKVLRADEGPFGSLLYRDLLKQITNDLAYHATAAQRAEAFLRCLNLWTP